MKKSLRLALLTVVFSAFSWGGVNAQTKTYTLSNANDDADKATEFTVDNLVFKIAPATAGKGNGATTKLSANKPYTLTLPDNLVATSISFSGYSNDKSTASTIASVTGGEEGAVAQDLSSVSFPNKNTAGNDPTKYATATATLNQTGGNVKFTTGAKQVCVTITVTGTLKAASKPTLTINPEAITLNVIPSQQTDAASLTVTGEKLAANAVVNLTTDVAGLTLEPASVTADANGAFTQTVKATYAPTADAAASTGTIIVSDGTNYDATTVNYFAKLTASTQKVVSEATTWDFSKTGLTTTYAKVAEPTLYSDLGATVSDDFAADAITYTGTYVLESNTDARVNSSNVLAFKTSVPGTLNVVFSNSGNNSARYLAVNGENTEYSSTTGTAGDAVGPISVAAGDVTISGSNWIKIYKIVFTPAQAETATISAAGYATYVTKGNVDFSGETTLKAYAAKYDATAQKITLTAVTAAPANTPLVLKGDAGDYKLTAATKAPADVSNNDLKAAKAAVTADGSQWILAQLNGGVGFAKCTPNTTIAAGKAYLVIPATTTAKSFIGFGEDTTNGIASVISEEASMKNARVYNLAGQQVNKAYKGVVIVNGKKYIQK